MVGLPDRWNPRVRLRDWLLKPTATEAAAAPYRFDGPVNIAATYSLQALRESTGRVYGSGISRDHGPFVVGSDGLVVIANRSGQDAAQ